MPRRLVSDVRAVRRTATVVRVVRCFGVSVTTTVLSATILVALAVGAGVAASTANVVAVCCGTAVSYLLNRRWVWQRAGRSSVAREVVPFWALNLVALAISTVVVDRPASVVRHWPAYERALALPLANVGVYGALWIVQFAVLDRLIFGAQPASRTSSSTGA